MKYNKQNFTNIFHILAVMAVELVYDVIQTNLADRKLGNADPAMDKLYNV